ncbi:hypothetical protein [Neobacillus sp. YIM B06451]|uniref:hypothetical protein n=1 Tax=Neobacillus sp. YIM B06451 TaxID=3070994 RepID=UPI00292E0DE3|nr:hypothetical protein [Neobacillus sp. YIM B06451]
MSLINNFDSHGGYTIENMLISEGFQKSSDGFKIELHGEAGNIFILVDEKYMHVSYQEKGSCVIEKRWRIFYYYESFFERYAMLLYKINELLSQ